MLRKISSVILLVTLFAFIEGCSAPKPKRSLTISEQIEVDTKSAQALEAEFEKKVSFVKFPAGEHFITQVARKIAKVQEGFSFDSVRIRIHQNGTPPNINKNLTRFFSFPGTTISVPLSFLKEVEYENELGAALAYELANIMNRHLAKKVEAQKAETVGNFELFGEQGLFELSSEERKASIHLGTRLLYFAGYDLRGMASVFQRYPQCFLNISWDAGSLNSSSLDNSSLGLDKKEVDFNIREARRAKSDYMPSTSPTVRSADFIAMKKEIKRL